jgi:RNA polymerase sigma-70 factor (ECF subfamily)
MMNVPSEEIVLAVRSGAGDQEALAELVERMRGPFFALAYAELRQYEDALDAVASALMQICRHIGDLREPEWYLPWMRSILRNEIRQIRRRSEPSSLLLEERDVPSADSPDLILRLDVERALARLPGDQAQAMVLHYLAGLPISRIAEQLDRPEGTVKRWLHLGRRRLSREMEEYRPMKAEEPAIPAPEAVLFYSSLEPAAVREMTGALKAGGFSRVHALTALPPLERTGQGDRIEFHLPKPLQRSRFFLMEDRFDGRSAFEWLLLLKATQEGRESASGLLLSSPTDAQVFAAWTAGYELCLTLPVNPEELQGFARKILEKLEERESDK